MTDENLDSVHPNFDWDFTWSDLRALVRTNALEDMPSITTFVVPNGSYVGDHISISRNMIALFHRQLRDGSLLSGGFTHPTRRALSSMAHQAAIHFARAEAAGADAAFWRLSRDSGLARGHRALDYVQAKVSALKETADQLQMGIDALEQMGPSLDEHVPVTPAPRGDPPVVAEDTGKGQAAGGTTGDGGAKPPATDDKPKGLVDDAITQATEIMAKIKGLAGEFEKKEEQDKVAEAIKAVVSALAGTAKAAIVSAITELLKAIDKGGEADDIDINIEKGQVTVYFRVRRGCLSKINIFVSDEFIYIEKNRKLEKFKFQTGDTAKQSHKPTGTPPP